MTAGGAFGSWAGATRWGGRPYITPMLNYDLYNYQTSATRLMYHSGLSLAIPYPILPTVTRNFSWEVLTRRDMIREKTLSSAKTTKWDAVFDDVVITETWEAPGGLSFPWRFFHDLHRVYLTDPDWLNGEYLLWRPMDRSERAYPIEIISITVDGEDFHVDWKGTPLNTYSPLGQTDVSCTVAGRDLLASKNLEIKFVIRPETAPNVAVFATPGSLTCESALFETE